MHIDYKSYMLVNYMDSQMILTLLNMIKMPCSCNKIIYNDKNIPIDIEYLHFNDDFRSLFKDVYSFNTPTSLRQILPLTSYHFNKFITDCADTLNGKSSYDEVIYDIIPGSWILTTVLPLEGNLILMVYTDIIEQATNRLHIDDFFAINLELMCVSSLDDIYLKVNNMFESIFGYTKQELEGQSMISIVHKDDQESTLEALNKRKLHSGNDKYINRCLCKDGSYRIIEWRSLEKGHLIFSTGQDITEEINTQAELNKKNDQLKKLATLLKKSNKKLEALANTDKLTGLYNRNFFDVRIAHEMKESDKNYTPLSMIIYDIDHFKNVNDDYGHPVGDEILKYHSSILSRFLRKSDYAFRIGGEEFAILLHNTNLEDATNIAENIRIAFESSPHPIAGKVTASFGVCQHKHNESFVSWYKKIDKALYVAKNKGRNQVIVYQKNITPIASLSIEWDSNWNSGNAHIDTQHKNLLSLAVEINDLMYSNGSNKDLANLINTLINQTQIHFADEEQLLKEVGYPDLNKHKATHLSLIDRALKLKDDYEQKKVKASFIISFLIDDVLMNHMLIEDIKFFSYFRKNS